MKYFTPDLYVRIQDRDSDAMDAADTAWATAMQGYDAYLHTILPHLPSGIRHLFDGYYLHDAEVLSAGRKGDTFVLLLQLDVSPNDLLSISYKLTAEPAINRSALPAEHRSSRMTWQYDELEEHPSGSRQYLHSILFGNGWEICVPFHEVQLATVQPIYPCPRQAAALTMPDSSRAD